MAGYTHKNLKRDVEDSAPKFGLAPDVEARFEAGADGLAYVAIGAPKVGSPADDVDGNEKGWWSEGE